MKIVSNYKDYYDFLIGQYGIDEKCVYERITSIGETKQGYSPEFKDFPNGYYSYSFYICGIYYPVFWWNGQILIGEEALSIPDTVKYGLNYKKNIHREVREMLSFSGTDDDDLNEKYNCPIILESSEYYNTKIFNPKLSDFNIGRILPPHDIFIKISNFLTREKEIIDNRTNDEKIISAGFDKKVSFRNMK